MPTLRLELDEETVRRMDTERELLGFESTTDYLEWVVRNRTAIEQGSERDQLLSEYARRVETLEAKVEAGEPIDAEDEDSGEPTVDGDDFSPERVTRIADEALSDDAGQLSGVESQRLDELARRAVARSRERLGRDVSTGLDYDSTTTIDEDLPPGADLVDLEEIDVPGYEERVVRARRVAVGAAVAYLKDNDRGRRGDIVDALYEQYPAGYDTADGWWRCVKRGFRQAPQVEGGEGHRVWRWAPTVDHDAPGATVTRISDDL
jgi:hypothetical protein